MADLVYIDVSTYVNVIIQ